MNRISWIFARFHERLGLAGYAVCSLTLLLLLFYFFAWVPLNANIASQVKHQSNSVDQMTQLSPEQDFNHFISLFPTKDERVENVETIINMAADKGLGIDNIAYNTSQMQGDMLSHYHVDFMLVGEYEALREYLTLLLHDLPMMSLDKLEMNRQDVEQEFVQARVRLTLHYSI